MMITHTGRFKRQKIPLVIRF